MSFNISKGFENIYNCKTVLFGYNIGSRVFWGRGIHPQLHRLVHIFSFFALLLISLFKLSTLKLLNLVVNFQSSSCLTYQ